MQWHKKDLRGASAGQSDRGQKSDKSFSKTEVCVMVFPVTEPSPPIERQRRGETERREPSEMLAHNLERELAWDRIFFIWIRRNPL
jgi:hypothetical protein